MAGILVICWLNNLASRQLFEHVDEFLCRTTGPSEPLANDFGIVRLPAAR